MSKSPEEKLEEFLKPLHPWQRKICERGFSLDSGLTEHDIADYHSNANDADLKVRKYESILRRIPAKWSEYCVRKRKAGGTVQAEVMGYQDPFGHSPDYRSVTMGGMQFVLTSRQAQIIQMLHEAWETERPELSLQYILNELDSPSSRLCDSFRTNKEAYKALIKMGKRRGTYRLNL